GSFVAAFLDLADAGDLGFTNRDIVDVEDIDRVFFALAILVDADDHLFAAINASCSGSGSLFDHRLGPASGDGLGHAAFGLDPLDDLPRLVDQLLRQAFDIIAAAQRIDHIAHAGLF